MLLRNLPELDTVVFGEGELSLLNLLRCLDEGGEPDGPGIVTRRAVEIGRSGARPPWVPLNANPVPEMAPYFEQLSDTGLDAEIEPRLAFELGRGCWWGEKHHCTFCGLNGENMAFRRKTRADVHQDILGLVQEHKVLDVIFADNILHPSDIAAVFENLPPDLDLRMHLEVKSNMKREEIRRLRRHGVWHMQPGIESLARRPLELMRKGTTPWQNIRFLRDAEEFGVTSSWNILTGFPGETADDYTEMIEQLPRLFHLQPPGSVGVIGLVRYSPLFNDPSLGVASKRPTPHTAWTYTGLSRADIETMAEVFECDGVFDVGEQVAAELRPLTDQWRREHPSTFLVERQHDDAITITRSYDSGVHTLHISEEWAVALWELLRPGRTSNALDRYLSGLSDREARLSRELLEELDVEHRVLYRDEGTLISLPARYEDHVPYRLTTT